jgi:protein required for attachment to host cells
VQSRVEGTNRPFNSPLYGDEYEEDDYVNKAYKPSLRLEQYSTAPRDRDGILEIDDDEPPINEARAQAQANAEWRKYMEQMRNQHQESAQQLNKITRGRLITKVGDGALKTVGITPRPKPADTVREDYRKKVGDLHTLYGRPMSSQRPSSARGGKSSVSSTHTKKTSPKSTKKSTSTSTSAAKLSSKQKTTKRVTDKKPSRKTTKSSTKTSTKSRSKTSSKVPKKASPKKTSS